MKKTLKISVTVLVLAVMVISCNNKRSTGRTFMPDMRFSKAYEYNTVNPNFADSMTNRLPVQGTIPRGFTPYHLQDTPEDYLRAATEVKNPLTLDEKHLANGKKLYTIYCQVCHGEKGDGESSMKKFQNYLVPNYKDRLPIIAEGQMFHSITFGRNLMGSHASQLSPTERWEVIFYIQKLAEVGPFAKDLTISDSTATIVMPAGQP